MMHAYDHFVAVDWAKANMAIARMTKESESIKVMDVPSDLEDLKDYLATLRGRKILTIEETTTSQWLYVELRDQVDELIVCDPYRNKLLTEGAKTDKIDASKLVKLLRANLLKPVFHSSDRLIALRKLVSGYNDVVQRGVRLKNQRSALYRAEGKDVDAESKLKEKGTSFILQVQERAIAEYERDKADYEEQFAKEVKASVQIRNLMTIPGIGTIGALKVASIVVCADRFSHKNYFHAYSGLVRLEKVSGGRSYGSKAPRCCKELKSVFKTAALCATKNKNCFSHYYEYMRNVKRLSDDKARHAVARLIATSALAVMRSKKKFNPKEIGALKALIK